MSDNKVLGLEPAKYVKIAYILLLVSTGVGVLTSLLAMAGVFTGLGGIANVAGLIGLIMAVIGWVGFKDKFSALDINHQQYIVVLFVGFLLLGIVVGAIFLMSPIALYGASLIFGILQFWMVVTGYNSWGKGRILSKDNIAEEMRRALKCA